MTSPTPAMRRLLIHLQTFAGWLIGDPVRAPRATIDAAERHGWVVVERLADGRPGAATITDAGRAAYPWRER